MKPSKLYSNDPVAFAPVEFQSELNVVLAEIRLPENRDRDTHNLGKTTLGRLDAVVTQLQHGAGTQVTLTLEVEATSDEGFSEADVSVVRDNAKQLKFKAESTGFE